MTNLSLSNNQSGPSDESLEAKAAAGPEPRGRTRCNIPEKILSNCSILIVEDEYLLADEVANGLMSYGAKILGPCPSEKAAFDMLDRADRIDGALLDLNLRGVQAFDLADALQSRGIPIVFATGYEPTMLPARFATVPRCVKPLRMNAIARALRRRIGRG